MVRSARSLRAPRPVRHELRHGRGRHTRFHRVGAAGQHDGHACAQHHAGGERVAQVFELLGQHVCRLRCWAPPGCRRARPPADDAADARGHRMTAPTSASEPSMRAPLICKPRSAILHSAAASSVAGMRGSRSPPRPAPPRAGRAGRWRDARSMALRTMSALASRSGAMLTRRRRSPAAAGRGAAGPNQNTWVMRRSVHRVRCHGGHHLHYQCVGVQRAFHQRLHSPLNAMRTAAPCAAAWLCGTSTRRQPSNSGSCCRASDFQQRWAR